MDYKKLSKICDSISDVFASVSVDPYDLMSCLGHYAERRGISIDYDKLYEATEDVFKDKYDITFISSESGYGLYKDAGLIEDVRSIQDTPTRDMFVSLIEDIESDPDEYFKNLNWEGDEPDWDSIPGGHDFE